MTNDKIGGSSPRRRVAITAITAVALVVLGGAVFMFWRRARAAEDTLQQVRGAWASRCDLAKSMAIGDIRAAVDSVRSGHPELASPQAPARTLAAYVFTCVGERKNVQIQDMAGKLAKLTRRLYEARRLDELDALTDQLQATPLDRWPSLTLPPTPPLSLVLAQGDEAEAANIEANMNAAARGSGAGSANGP